MALSISSLLSCFFTHLQKILTRSYIPTYIQKHHLLHTSPQTPHPIILILNSQFRTQVLTEDFLNYPIS